MARRRDDEGGELPPEDPFPDPDEEPRPVPDTGETRQRLKDVSESRFRWAEALYYWHIGNEESVAQHFADAEVAYEECQKAVVRYFEKFYTTSALNLRFDIPPNTPTSGKVAIVVGVLFDARDHLPELWAKLRRRREAITLEELQKPDWSGFSAAATQLLTTSVEVDTAEDAVVRQKLLDYFALILATVFVPLARAEMNRARRNFNAAIEEYDRLLTAYRKPAPDAPLVWLTCDFIERPFILLSLGETRMEKAEAQFKAASQGKADGARATYQSISDLFKDHGTYVAAVASAQTAVAERANQPLETATNQQVMTLQAVGHDITVPGITSMTRELPGLSLTRAPAESWLQFQDTVDGEVVSEINPRVYSLLLSARARLLQIDNGFNYIGYSNDYIPPWRFQFLLERARYFAEHAKNAQRDYLNFLSNAEREEFQEQNAAQAVEMEKANVRIESARVEQVAAEVIASRESWKLAKAVAANAQGRLSAYNNLDGTLRDLEEDSIRSSIQKSFVNMFVSSFTAKSNPSGVGGSVVDLVGSLGGFGRSPERTQVHTARVQRSYEKLNLSAAIAESGKAATVAEKQYAAAQAGFTVSCLQRQAALLRHEFAIQNLRYLRNRALNAEQWFRLANAIRGVADTYLRYTIELAFLAEQAYEFEADKRINVVRFDYDQSEVGAYLAADFLLTDLDTIEQDFIVNQRQRQQQVRYVLSLAREFPAALEELRDIGKVNFVLRLEQIEKRFPGLYNARIGMVEVLPIALMDSTRFSLDVTHVGSGQLRIKGEPDVREGEQSESVLNVSDLPPADYDWTRTPKELWPVKILVNEPETAVFSGLSRQDAAAAFPVASSGQRNAFEGRAVAGGWQIDMSSRENQVVPDSLVDVLITFTVSGYHDSGLREAIEAARPRTTALTHSMSAQQIFPDAFYEFSRSGRMVWQVPREILAVSADLGRLRNIGFSLRPAAPDVHFSRLMTRLRMSFRIDKKDGVASGVTVFTVMPDVSITQASPMTIAVRAALDDATELSWDFGDGSPILGTVRSGSSPIVPAEGSHTFAKPGRYVIRLRSVQNESLCELRFAVRVSRRVVLGGPLIVTVPRFTFDTTAQTLTVSAGGALTDAARLLWRVGELTDQGGEATFRLKPGHYVLDFAAIRKLNYRVYGTQRYVNGATPLALSGFRAATNRTFDDEGKETNGTGQPPLPVRNRLARRLFDKGPISPEDDWTFELIPEEVLGVPAGTSIDGEALDLSDIDDVVLSMEYDVTSSVPVGLGSTQVSTRSLVSGPNGAARLFGSVDEQPSVA